MIKFPLLALAASLSVTPAAAETLLKLSEAAHIAVHPDRLNASLRAEANTATPAEAQAQVNAAITEALRAAHQVPGIEASTGFYQVWQGPKPSVLWHAAQSLDLGSSDGGALLRLVGAQQARGLALERLAWVVAPATAREAQSAATKQALSRLQARAEEAAGILGLHFLSFREVRLGGSRPPPMPGPRVMAMAAAASSAPPPSAEAQDVDVDASVEGDALLGSP